LLYCIHYLDIFKKNTRNVFFFHRSQRRGRIRTRSNLPRSGCNCAWVNSIDSPAAPGLDKEERHGWEDIPRLLDGDQGEAGDQQQEDLFGLSESREQPQRSR